MGLAQHIIRYGIVMGRAMWEASKKGINLFKKPTFTDKKRKVLDRQRKEFDAKDDAVKDHDDAMRSQKSLDRFYSTSKGKKVLKELDDKRYLKKWNAKNKEAVFKFSSPLSGKNLPFSSLYDKLKKDKNENEE